MFKLINVLFNILKEVSLNEKKENLLFNNNLIILNAYYTFRNIFKKNRPW